MNALGLDVAPIAPEGSKFVTTIVIGIRPDGMAALEQRLPAGVAFDGKNPLHVFGWFVANYAQELMNHAAYEYREASRKTNPVNQTSEIVAVNSLPIG